MINREYRVQSLWHFKNGTTEWTNWGSYGVLETLRAALNEKRRGEQMYPDNQFRVVYRDVTPWTPVEGDAK